MPLKQQAKNWTIKEQIVTDEASGLTIQFEMLPDGEPRLRLFGENLPFGNREIMFHRDGTEAGAGTCTGLCRPAWVTSTEDF